MLVVLVVSGVQHVDCITFSTLSFFLCVKRKEKEKEREREEEEEEKDEEEEEEEEGEKDEEI